MFHLPLVSDDAPFLFCIASFSLTALPLMLLTCVALLQCAVQVSSCPCLLFFCHFFLILVLKKPFSYLAKTSVWIVLRVAAPQTCDTGFVSHFAFKFCRLCSRLGFVLPNPRLPAICLIRRAYWLEQRHCIILQLCAIFLCSKGSAESVSKEMRQIMPRFGRLEQC